MSEIDRTYEQMRKCDANAIVRLSLEEQVVICESLSDSPDDTAAYASCKTQISGYEQKLQAAAGVLQSCPSQDLDSIKRDYYSATKAAATAGNADAQICYFVGDFGIELSDAEIQQYEMDAIRYAKEALWRGDWRMVGLLAGRQDAMTGLMTRLPIGTPQETYRMNRLLRLGAVGNYAMALDLSATEAASQLTTRQVARADSWALEEFNKFFLNSPHLENYPYTACGNID